MDIGGSPVEFLQKHHARISSVHLKDRKSKDNGGANVAWGTGDTPIKDILIVGRATPSQRVNKKTLTHRYGARAHGRRQRCQQLRDRPFGRGTESRVSHDPRLREQKRPQLRVVPPWHARTPVFVELPAASRASQRRDRDTCRADRILYR